jgi:hypothetical protein
MSESKKRGRPVGYKLSDESKAKLSISQKAAWADRKAEAAYLASVEPIKQGLKDHTA